MENIETRLFEVKAKLNQLLDKQEALSAFDVSNADEADFDWLLNLLIKLDGTRARDDKPTPQHQNLRAMVADILLLLDRYDMKLNAEKDKSAV